MTSISDGTNSVPLRVGVGTGPALIIPKSATLGGAFRYLFARTAFFNTMVGCDQIQGMFRQWVERDGWEERIRCGQEALSRLAGELNLEHPWQLTDLTEDTVPDTEAKFEAGREVFKFLTAMQESGSRYPDEMLGLLSNLNVPWPWLATALVASFYEGLHARLRDITVRTAIRLRDIPPTPRFAFTPETDESTDDAVRRFDEHVQTFLAQANLYRDALADGLVTARGSIPQRTRASIERNAGWFFRRIVCGESLNSIARDAGVERANVRRAITDVGKLLEEAPV
jgi:hypothetical protein